MKFIDLGYGAGFRPSDTAFTVNARYNSAYGYHKREHCGVAYFFSPHRASGGALNDKDEANTVVARYYKGTGDMSEPHVKYRIEGEEMWKHSLISAGRRGEHENKGCLPDPSGSTIETKLQSSDSVREVRVKEAVRGGIPWHESEKIQLTSHSPTATPEGEESEPG